MTRSMDRPVYRVIATLLCVSLVSPAAAQITDGKTAFDTLKLAGQRAPGTLVGDGVSRAQQRVLLPFGGTDIGGVTITETERTESRTDVFFGTLVDAIVTAIEAAISKILADLIAAFVPSDFALPDFSTPVGTTAPGGSTTPGNTTTPGGSTTPGSTDPGRGGRR